MFILYTLNCQLQGKGVGVSMARAQAGRAGNMEDGEDGMYIVAVWKTWILTGTGSYW